VTDPKPLHVRVAIALGCTPKLEEGFFPGPGNGPEWLCSCGPRYKHSNFERYLGPFGPGRVSRYDTDWSATGPLIVAYDIWLQPCKHEGTPKHWTATSPLDDHEADADGSTPLEAICNLILALAEAGKLPVEVLTATTSKP
jgi:hypothetical protein